MRPARHFALWTSLRAASVSLILGALSCKRGDTAATNSGQPNLSQGAGSTYFKTSFQNESEFVIENITTDIAEMVFFAVNHRLPDPTLFSVHARETGGTPDAPTYNVTVKFGRSH